MNLSDTFKRQNLEHANTLLIKLFVRIPRSKHCSFVTVESYTAHRGNYSAVENNFDKIICEH